MVPIRELLQTVVLLPKALVDLFVPSVMSTGSLYLRPGNKIISLVKLKVILW